MKKCPLCEREVSCRNWRYGTSLCSRCDGRLRSRINKLKEVKIKNEEK